MLKTLQITRPDDWHVHFRDGAMLQNTVPATSKHFARALAMPNLKPALTSLDMLLAYRERLLLANTHVEPFDPFLTFYLNETINPDDLIHAKKHPFILGGKLYPAGATTNSAEGVASIQRLYPILEVMQAQELVLQIHGEVTFGDIFDRELLFIKNELPKLIRDFPKLRIVLEHISTKAAVDFILQSGNMIAATITPHHLLFNRNQLLAQGLHPHYYCLPILKREQDQMAIQRAAFSGDSRFFAGTDSAPHARDQKESACGCAGVYSAPYALAMYAEVFDKANQLKRLQPFTSEFGAAFYQLPVQTAQIELRQQKQVIPTSLPLGNTSVVPLAAGSTLSWSIHEPN